MKLGPFVHSSTHDQFEVCTMVIHAIDRCGRLAEDDISEAKDFKDGKQINTLVQCDRVIYEIFF